MSHLVGFFDILGTSEMVTQGSFSEYFSFDFVNPVGLAAMRYPEFKFAVFSDNAVISCDASRASEFVFLITELHMSWFADHIFVRGGVALGDIQWVEFDIDKKFNGLSNFSFSRVYGEALIEAYNSERRSGPGALCFVSEDAAAFLKKKVPGSIFSTLSHILVWMPTEKLDHLIGVFKDLSEKKEKSIEAQRHFLATVRLLKQIRKATEK